MHFKFTSRTNIFLILLLIFTIFPTTIFAQDGTQTYTTSDGLSFDYPEGWNAESIGGIAFVTSNSESMAADELAVGDVIVLVMGGNTLTDEYGDFDDLDAAADGLATTLAGEGSDLNSEAISLGGHNGYRFEMTDDFGRNMFIVLDIDGQFAAIVAVTHPDDFANQEATIVAIAESFRYDGAEPTDAGGVDFDFGGFDDEATTAPTVGNEIIVWQQQYPVSENIFEGLGAASTMSINGDTIYVTDGLNLAQVDGDGNMSNFVASSQFTFLNDFVVLDDGSIWAGTFAEDVVIHMDAMLNAIEGWNNSDFESPIFGDTLGVQEIAVGPDGDLYMFTGRFDESFNSNGTILVWNDGAFVREFSVQGEGEFGMTTFGFDAQIAFLPDGNILLVDSSFNMKVVDSDGNLVRDDFPSSSERGIYGLNDVAVLPDGTIILATFEGILRLTPEGEIIDTFGTIQEFDSGDDAPEFEMGQLGPSGPLAVGVLSDGSVIVISTNGSYNLVVRLDYSLVE